MSPSHVAPKHHEFMDRARFPVDEWRLVENHISSEDLGITETLFAVANGYLGMRGNVDEGRDSYSHGTFINGFHETWQIHHAEEAYGFAKVGQTIVNVPDSKVIRLYVDVRTVWPREKILVLADDPMVFRSSRPPLFDSDGGRLAPRMTHFRLRTVSATSAATSVMMCSGVARAS